MEGAMKLEVPRLQIVWEKDEKSNYPNGYIATYEMVLYEGEEALLDCRANDEDGRPSQGIVKVKMGQTKVSGGKTPLNYDGDKLEMPFRDGTHIMRDSIRLGNLPMYVICGEQIEKVEQALVEVDGKLINKSFLKTA
jgi:hypothetical protein